MFVAIFILVAYVQGCLICEIGFLKLVAARMLHPSVYFSLFD